MNFIIPNQFPNMLEMFWKTLTVFDQSNDDGKQLQMSFDEL